MVNVLFSRTDSPSTKPITDGQIIFDTSGNGKMYLDNGTTRLEMGGAIDVDTTLDATSTNPIQNKGVAGVMLSELEEVRGTTKKGFLTDALATKTLDAKIGTTDISSIGDGTVTGAISDVTGKLDTVTEAIVHDNITGIFTYTRIGHMCIGCGTLTTTNDIDAYSAIVSNLPQTYTGNPYPGAFVAEDNTYNDFYINGSAIVNRKPVSKGHILRLSCVYMCQ
jgi:hypothetical protein